MAIDIEHKDLKLFLRVMKNHPYEITDGTTTAFINSYCHSVFTPTMDKKFESWIVWFAHRFHDSRKIRQIGKANAYIIELMKKPQSFSYDLDPSGYFDMEDGLSYTQMMSAIDFTCTIHNFEPKLEYYRYPYSLYSRIMNTDLIERYIEDVALPPLKSYYHLRETKEAMLKAYLSGENYRLDTFYPEKLIQMASCYMYEKERKYIMQVYQKYGFKSPHFETVFKN